MRRVDTGSAKSKTGGIVGASRDIVVKQQCESGSESEDDIAMASWHTVPLSV